MLHLIPPRLHRALLRIAYRLRVVWRRIVAPTSDGVSIVALDGEGGLLLVRHSYGWPFWMLPGGGMKRGEAPELAARREFGEELTAELIDPVFAGICEEDLDGSLNRVHVVRARVDPAQIRPDGREVIAARFFPCDALPRGIGDKILGRLALAGVQNKVS